MADIKHKQMADITTDWLKKKGFKRNDNFFELEKDGVTFGFDLINGLCWVDGESIYAMKSVDTTDEVEQLYGVCGFDLKFKGVENEKADDYPITPAWLAMSGFDKKGEHKWVSSQNGITIKYDTSTKVLSLIKGKEGYEGVVKSEDFARKIIYDVFSE